VSPRNNERLLERRRAFKASFALLNEKFTRNWMLKRGRAHLLDFSEAEVFNLKRCFDSLDDDGSGTIAASELEAPLIGLGFANDREDIAAMVAEVDEDGSGEIDFDEFLLIIKNSNTKAGNDRLN